MNISHVQGQNVIGVATDRDILEYLEVEKAKRDVAKEKERAKKETSVRIWGLRYNYYRLHYAEINCLIV